MEIYDHAGSNYGLAGKRHCMVLSCSIIIALTCNMFNMDDLNCNTILTVLRSDNSVGCGVGVNDCSKYIGNLHPFEINLVEIR